MTARILRLMPAALPSGVTVLALVAALSLLGGSNRNASAALPPPVGWSTGPSLPTSYSGAWDSVYAYFPPMDQVVVFGGAPKVTGESWNNDTWILSAGQWTMASAPPAGLTPRGGSAMAYDPAMGKLVLFSGAGAEWPYPSDVWFWDGSRWTADPTPPSALKGRVGARMVFDDALGKLVLYGGSGDAPYTDTWLFDGSTWTQGPTAPPSMGPRVDYSMTYDPVLQKVLVAGGNGGTDAWYFDGSSWTPAPSIAAIGPKERFSMAYDPQLGGPVLFSGLGLGSATSQMWLLRGGQWSQVPGSKQNLQGTPTGRVDGFVLWDPAYDALMVGAGVDDILAGTVAFHDTWFFREVPPTIASASITPTDPNQTQSLKLTVGAVTNGYGSTLVNAYQWYVNGVLVPGVTGKMLTPTGHFVRADNVYAKVTVTDALGFTGTVLSNTVTIVDRRPTLTSATIGPSNAYMTSTLTATGNNVKDPDGDLVTLHYVWKVNGTVKGGDASTLAPSNFTSNDTVTLSITPVDILGLAGQSVQATPKTIQWNIAPNGTVQPGANYGVKGGGFWASEQVDLRLDGPTGPVLDTLTAASDGSILFTNVTVPVPLSGGTHTLFGVGRTSGIVGQGPMAVVPGGSLSQKSVGAGDPTTFTGSGFAPGEQVSASFPGGQPGTQTADSTGSVSIGLVSPPEPVTGGVVTAAAPSGSTSTTFSVITRATLPAMAEPMDVVTLNGTGYAPGETVNVTIGGSQIGTFTADATGSVRGPLTLATRFGNNQTVNVTGASSGALASPKVDFPAWLTLMPNSGPSGSTIEVVSGPGWVSGETLTIWWGTQQVKQVQADTNGSIDATFVSPAHNPANVTVKITEAQLGLTPTATFTVTSLRRAEA